MREIKFRAWGPNSNYMWPWEELQHVDMKWLNDGYGDKIIMQYTGLKDKNGKEIFEGDIIQSVCETVNLLSSKPTGRFKTDNYEVRWQNEKGGWGRWTGEKFGLLHGLDESFLHKWYSIIGNIYENRELLK